MFLTTLAFYSRIFPEKYPNTFFFLDHRFKTFYFSLMNNIKIFVILSSLVLISCKRSEKSWYTTFDPITNTIILKSSDSLQSLEMARPRELLVKESTLFLEDEKLEHFVHIVDVNKMSLLRSNGVKGKGPGELISIYGAIDLHNEDLWFYDGKLSKYVGYHTDSLLNGKATYRPITNEVRIDPNLELFNVSWLSDSVIIGYGFSENNFKFTLIDIKNDSISHFGELPPNPDNIPNRIHKQAYDGIFKVQPKGDKIAFVSLYTDLVEIHDFSKNSTVRLKTNYDFAPLFEIVDGNKFLVMGLSGETRLGYRSLYVTEKKIYALFSGQTMDESRIEKNISIHIFNWNGEFEKSIKLDRSAASIAVDENDLFLYSVIDSEIPTILKYKLTDDKE